MKKQILSEELKRMKRLAGIITESQYNKLIEENYSVQNFITDFSTAEFFKPFLQAVVTDKNNVGLDMNNSDDWDKIMSMNRKQLQDTFGLTMGTAMKLYNALQPKIKAADQTTVDGRAAGLNDFFKQGGTSGDYAEFKAMNDHFINGGEIENLEPKLKNIYMSKYKPFTKEQFMEIFKKVNINENIDEARYGRGSVDPWADIETGGEYSKSKERVSASYKRQKEEDSLGSTSYQSFTNKIKRLGNLMTDDEAVEMMDDMKRMLSQDEIMDVYNFVDRNNISSPIYTYLDQYKGETGSYGLEENGGFDIEKTKQPVDLSQYDLEPLKQKFLRMHGEIPTDEELRNIISVMKLEEAQDSEDVTIQEGQLGRTIAKMLIEEMLKENEEEVAKRVQELLNPHDYITLKAGTLLTINRPPGFIQIPKETEAVYFGVNKFNQVEVAVRKDLGWNTGTVEFGDIRDLFDESGSYGLEDVPPYEGPEDPMDHQVAEVMIKEGQLGRTIAKMLIEEMLKENVDDVLKNEIQKVEPENQIIQYVKDKVLDGKKYTVKYGGPGMPVGEYEMTIADLISRAWEAKVKKGIENWSDNDWSQIRDYINMKLS